MFFENPKYFHENLSDFSENGGNEATLEFLQWKHVQIMMLNVGKIELPKFSHISCLFSKNKVIVEKIAVSKKIVLSNWNSLMQTSLMLVFSEKNSIFTVIEIHSYLIFFQLLVSYLLLIFQYSRIQIKY